MTRLVSLTLIIALPAVALWCGYKMGDKSKLPDINPALYSTPLQKQVKETGGRKPTKQAVEFSGTIPLSIE